MILESMDKKSSISFEYVDSELKRYPSVSFLIDVVNDGFMGCNKDVWFELDALKLFLSDLRQLDNTRRGSASIESMSPDEFYLCVESYDMSGHLLANYRIARYDHHPKLDKISLSGRFEIDPSYFTQIVNGFAKVTDENKYPTPKYPFIQNIE